MKSMIPAASSGVHPYWPSRIELNLARVSRDFKQGVESSALKVPASESPLLGQKKKQLREKNLTLGI
jgi:hypothetical protein